MKMKHALAITILFLIHALFFHSVIAQDYTQWKLPEGAKARLGKGQISGISFSPDGSQIAVGSATGIWLYDARTGAELALFTDYMSETGLVAFSPDGKTLVNGMDDTILIWDIATGKLLKSIKRQRARIESLRILEDSKTLLCENYDGSVRLWDVTTGLEKKKFNPKASGGFGGVLQSAFGYEVTAASLYLNKINDNGIYAVGYKNGKIRLKDATTGKLQKTLQGPKDRVSQLVFSPDGTLLVADAIDGPLRLWDITTGRTPKILTQDAKLWGVLTFSKDGKTLACQSQSGKIELWDVATKTLRTTLGEDSRTPIHTFVFSPDAKTVVTANPSGKIRIWDTDTGAELSVFSTGHTRKFGALAFSPDSTLLASGHINTIMLWDARTFTQLSNRVDTNAWINALAFSADGSTVSSVKSFRFKRRTRGAFIKEGVSSTLSLWDTRTGDKLSDLPVESYLGELPKLPGVQNSSSSSSGAIGMVVFSQNGSMLATALNSDRATEDYRFTVHLWNIPHRTVNLTLKGHTDTVNALAFTPNGNMLASGSDDKTIRLWDTSTGTEILNMPSGKIHALAFSMDGKILASINSVFRIQLWDVGTGSQLTSIEGQNNYGNVLAFSTDSKILACGSRDGTIRLWDVATGNKLSTLKGHVDWVHALRFSPNGNTLASGSSDGAIFLWNVPH